MRAVLILTQFTLREALRKKALLAVVVLTLLFLALYGTGVYFSIRESHWDESRRAMMTMALSSGLLSAGLLVLNSIAGLLAILSAVGSIASQVDDGTIQTVVTRPLGRWQIVVGKWLGMAIVLVVYIFVTGLAALVIVWANSGFFPEDWARGLAYMCLSSLLLLSFCIALSTIMPTMAGGVSAFVLYSLATLGGTLEQVGRAIDNGTMVTIGVVTSLIMPTDSMWKMASGSLQSSLPGSVLTSGQGPFALFSAPAAWLVPYAFLYLLVWMGVALFVFQRRDL